MTKKSTGWIRVAAIAAASALALSGCATDAPAGSDGDTNPIRIRIASPVPESNQGGQSIIWWKEQIEERTGGKVQVELYHGGAFMPGSETLVGVGDGLIEAGLFYSVYNPAEMPLYNLAGMPFVTNDGTAATAAFNELYESNDLFRSQFEDVNVDVLFFAPDGASPIGLTEKVTDPSGLQGKRLRVTGYVANALAQVGADSTFVEFAELYEALQRGTVQGWAGSGYPATTGLGLPEVTPFYHQPGIGVFSNIAVVINHDVLEGLPEDVKATIQELREEYPAWITNRLMEIEAEACDAVIAAGGEAVVWDDAAVAKLKAAVGSTVEDGIRAEALNQGLTDEQFDSVLSEYLSLVAAAEAESTYVEGLTLCAQR